MKRHLNVLITGMGSANALCVLKGLHIQNEFDVFVLGTDINEKNNIAGSSFCDKFCQVPPAADEEAYIGAIVDIIKSNNIDLLIPFVGPELEVLSRNRDFIEQCTYPLVSSYETVMICNDKLKTYYFLKSMGYQALETAYVHDYSKIKEIISVFGLSYPFIAKPRKGAGSRGVYQINNEEELVLIKRVEEPIIQEMGIGDMYVVDLFCDGKKVLSAVPRKTLEVRAGLHYKTVVERDQKLIEESKKLAEKLDFRGPVNIQWFKNGDSLRVLEINPRFSGSCHVTTAAGVNNPLMALKMAAGDELETIEDFKIVKMCRHWEEVFYDI